MDIKLTYDDYEIILCRKCEMPHFFLHNKAGLCSPCYASQRFLSWLVKQTTRFTITKATNSLDLSRRQIREELGTLLYAKKIIKTKTKQKVFYTSQVLGD